MKKLHKSKLTLNRSTIRRLDPTSMSAAVGAATDHSGSVQSYLLLLADAQSKWKVLQEATWPFTHCDTLPAGTITVYC